MCQAEDILLGIALAILIITGVLLFILLVIAGIVSFDAWRYHYIALKKRNRHRKKCGLPPLKQLVNS